MIDLNKLRVFFEVGKTLNFTRASETLKIRPSVITRHVHDLEREIGTKLFERHYRGVLFTESGEWLYKKAQKIFLSVGEVEQGLSIPFNPSRETLRIATSPGLASDWLIPFIAGFKKLNPEINIFVSSHTVDFKLEESLVDMALLPRIVGQKKLTQTLLTTFDFRLFASKEYIQRKGEPQSLDDLKSHDFIGFSEDERTFFKDSSFQLSFELKMEPSLIVNSALGVLQLCKLGFGIALISPQLNAFKQEKLVEILPDLPPCKADLYCIYRKQKEKSTIIQSFYEYLSENIKG